MKSLFACISGLVFGIGLLVSGMADPANVTGFLDVAGRWTPLLAYVMGGAVAVTLPGFWWLRRRSEGALQWPARWPPDVPLIAGSVIFGFGWGLTGVCPGPALVLLGLGAPQAVLFVLSILVGWKAIQLLSERRQ
ncbi:DUF6691 family protein [Acetobacter thailandicus]|uniref:DUF6691 family protein n=1 Tax=Acetobacter thailandicus TaxID=1502842 RepID=UPI001BABD032|nr:DUF6691 family protein [Acetobacter thailandicus]MBS0980020.1 YeeE/YedE family protein [Acetobacter thailandicus]